MLGLNAANKTAFFKIRHLTNDGLKPRKIIFSRASTGEVPLGIL